MYVFMYVRIVRVREGRKKGRNDDDVTDDVRRDDTKLSVCWSKQGIYMFVVGLLLLTSARVGGTRLCR